MMKTITLPKNLATETAALVEHEAFELMYQSHLINVLNEEFEDVSFTPDEKVIDNILSYSKAVEVQRSKTMVENHVVIMN